MNNSPHTFFHDESPPTSPVLPTFHPSPAPPGHKHKAERSEHLHRRWHSLARSKPHPLVFSYEYIFEDGKLAGLAERNPDDDYLHYASSRGSSAPSSRYPSCRTSAEHSTRSSTDTRYSYSSEHSHPPSSPRTSDRIKRALSLSRTRAQRSSSDGKRRMPSPDIKSRGSGLERLTKATPVEPTPPNERDVPVVPFESPRAAPPTPTRRTKPSEAPKLLCPAFTPLYFGSSRAASPPPTCRSAKPASEPITAPAAELNRKKSMRLMRDTRPKKLSISAEGKERPFEGQKQPAFVDSTLGQASGATRISGSLQMEKIVARPSLHRKTSKFIEHLNDKPTEVNVKAEKNGVQVIPSIPPCDVVLPTRTTQPELPQSPQRQHPGSRHPLRRSQTVTRRDPNYTHPEWPSIFNASLPARTVPDFALGPRNQPLPDHIVKKRSASKMKAAGSFQSANKSLKRATSNPMTIRADICMAEIKPTLTSPVIAKGHARLISC